MAKVTGITIPKTINTKLYTMVFLNRIYKLLDSIK